MGPKIRIDRCPYCSGRFYALGDGMHKCAACRRKLSLKKAQRDADLIAAFCRGETAHAAAEAMRLSYKSVTARFEKLRLLAAGHLEREYERHRDRVGEYEEYIYLEASKRHDRRNIFDAHDVLTFDYGGRVYNLLMPALHRFRQEFLEDGLDEVYYARFEKFLRTHRIARLKKQKNIITDFWDYFETFITRYKGIRRENFPYYLKEAEFLFNYGEQERYKILFALWFAP